MRARNPSLVHHRPTGQARVRIDGRDFYCGKFGSPEAEARYRELLALKEAGKLPARERKSVKSDRPAVDPLAPLSVDLLAARYITEHATIHYRHPDGTPTTEIDGVRNSIQWLIDFAGREPAANFGPKRLKALRDRMILGGLSRRTTNQYIGRIRRAFRWAASEELIPAAVYQGLATVPGLQAGRSAATEYAPVGPVDWSVVERTIPFLSLPLRSVVLLQWHTGARGGELLSLRKGDIDTTGDVWTFCPDRHKNSHRGKSRTILFGREAQAILTPLLLAKRDGQYLFCPRDVRRRAGVRDKYDSRSYCHAVADACERAGVTPWHPHQLRHAYATRVRKLAGIEQTRVLLGHSSAVTSELYAEADLAEACAVVARLG